MAIEWLETIVDITPGTTGSYQDVDVTSNFGSSVTGVIVECVNSSGTTREFGIRVNGSSDAQERDINDGAHEIFYMGVDGDDIVEVYVENGDLDVYLHGGFHDEATFFTNRTDLAVGSPGGWRDEDITSFTTGDSTQVILYAETINGQLMGARENGSTDNRTTEVDDSCGCIMGVDGDEIVELYVDTWSTDWHIVGYITEQVTSYTNATEYSPTSDATWEDLTALPAGATGGFFEMSQGAGVRYDYDIRRNGSSRTSQYGTGATHSWYASECDGSRVCEGYLQNEGDQDIFLNAITETGAINFTSSLGLLGVGR